MGTEYAGWLRKDAKYGYVDVSSPTSDKWSAHITGFRFDNFRGFQADYSIPSTLAVVASAERDLILPVKLYNFLVNSLSDILDFFVIDSASGSPPIFDCHFNKRNLPSIYILYGDVWFEILASDYVRDLRSDGKCTFNFARRDSTETHITLGITFMTGFYTAFDLDARRMGFIPHIASNKDSPISGTKPTNSYEDYDDDFETLRPLDTWLMIILISSSGMLTVALGFYLIWFFCDRNGTLTSGSKYKKEDEDDFDKDNELLVI